MIVLPAERLAWFQSQRNVTLTPASVSFLDQIQPWIERACWNFIGYTLEQATYTEFLPTPSAERPPLSYGIDIGWDLIGGTAMPRTRTDLYEGGLHLSNLPVRSITSVYENLAAWTGGEANGSWPASSLLDARAYRLDFAEPGLCKSGRLFRVVGGWSSTPRAVKVTYVAGYTQAEIDAGFGPAKLAVLEALGWWWGKAQRASASSKTQGMTALNLSIRDFAVTLGLSGTGSDPSAAQNVLPPSALLILMPLINYKKFVGN